MASLLVDVPLRSMIPSADVIEPLLAASPSRIPSSEVDVPVIEMLPEVDSIIPPVTTSTPAPAVDSPTTTVLPLWFSMDPVPDISTPGPSSAIPLISIRAVDDLNERIAAVNDDAGVKRAHAARAINIDDRVAE